MTTMHSPVLRPGDTVRLVSPSSYPDAAWVAESTAILESWGLGVEVGEHALDQWGYMAGRDQDRLDDLNAAFRAPHVRAIITTRGGAGACSPGSTTTPTGAGIRALCHGRVAGARMIGRRHHGY